MAHAALQVGSVAPDALGSAGAPRVVAFVRDWTPDPEPLRGYLRGLAAELIVHADDGVWRLGADDAIDHVDLAAIAELSGDDAVYVIDGDGVVRFAHVLHEPPDLAGALAAAIEAMHERPAPITFNRREWVTTCLVAGCAFAFLRGCKAEDARPAPERPSAPAGEVSIVLDVNGTRHALSLEPRVSLLDALRERLGLTGTKKGCDAGQCGACTVHVEGRRVLACMTLAAMADGKPITTIEGLARGGQLHVMQAAFVEHDALQCGFCTPGQIMSAVAVLVERRADTDDEVREQMSGNICRCGAYPNILAAIQAARRGG